VASASVVTTAATVAAALIALLSVGSWEVLAVLLAVVAWDSVAAGALLASTVALAARLGSTSLPALAGAQAVLGPAVMTRPPAAAASSAMVAAAILLVAPNGVRAIPFGLAAALLVAGPAAGDATAVAVRLLAAGGCVELAVAVGRVDRLARWRPAAAGVAALLGVVLAFSARPPGGRWPVHATEVAVGAATAAVAAGLTAVAVVFGRRRMSVWAERV
jgi:hypothetical protein